MFLPMERNFTPHECVHHVPEQVFRMSPVYTEGGLAPALSFNNHVICFFL